MEAVHQNRAAPGPRAASAVGLHPWWVLPAWSILASQQMVAQGWRMLAERQGALMQAQLRLACLPWLLATHAVRALPRPGPKTKAGLAAPARAPQPPADAPPAETRPASNVVRLHLVR